MTRSLKTGLAGLVALLATTPAGAQLRVAQPQDIVEAMASCMAATSPGNIDAAQLEADGWGSAPLSAEGKPVDTPLRFFSREQSASIIMTTSGTSADGVCIASARIATIAGFAEVERALATRFGGQIAERKTGETMFFAGGKVVSLALTGNPRTPAVRIGVMQMSQEKK